MKKNAGDNILTDHSSWSFSGDTYKNFDTHILKSVPLYDWSHYVGLKISDFFLSDGANMVDLGSSTGTFIKKLAIKNKNKKIRYTGYDTVENMIKSSKKNCKKIKNAKFIKQDFSKKNIIKNNFTTSFYTLQFIHPSKRLDVLKKIFKSLEWGGGFLIFEKVRAPDARFQDMMTTIYHDFKLENGFNSEEILMKSFSLKGILEPFSSSANINLIKKSGFKDVMTVFKFINFEGILAIK